MSPNEPFKVRPSKLHKGGFFVSGSFGVCHTAEDELTYGFVTLNESQAKTLAYMLNAGYRDEQTLKTLKTTINSILKR